MTILIISENRLLGNLLAKELRGERFRSSIVCDPFRIWDQIAQSHPDLVLVDVDLQRGNCWQLLLDIKSEYRELPVLIYVYTGPESFNKLKQAIDAALPGRFCRHNDFYRPAPSHRRPKHPV